MTDSSDDSELHLAPNAAPRPRLLDDAVTISPPAAPEPVAPPRRRRFLRFLVFVGTSLVAGLIAASAGYWFEREYSPPGRPLSVLKPIRQALPTPPSLPLRVPSDSLHVTSIVLGHVPLAVVNGKQLAEGDWLEVRTTEGVAALHVIGIEDGAVHFGYGGRVIDATFDRTLPSPTAP